MWRYTVDIAYPLCFIPFVYNGKRHNALIDTGAQVSIITHKLAENLGLTHRIKREYAGEARGVGKAVIHGLIVGVEIEIAGKSYIQSFEVMDMDKDMEYLMLLGLDFLTNNNCDISLRKRTITITDNVAIPFIDCANSQSQEPVLLDIVKPKKNILEQIIFNIISNPNETRYRNINAKKLTTVQIDTLKNFNFAYNDDRLLFIGDNSHLELALDCVC